MFSRILHVNDGSDGAFKALAAAIGLAKRHGAELHTASVEETPSFWVAGEKLIEARRVVDLRLRLALERARIVAGLNDIEITAHLVEGHQIQAIVTLAAIHGFDLLVVGFTPKSTLHDYVLGGTTSRLVSYVSCPVLVIK